MPNQVDVAMARTWHVTVGSKAVAQRLTGLGWSVDIALH
jgi:hypothetical protein